MEELRQIALDLLDTYEKAARIGIYKSSGHIAEDLAELDREVTALRERIVSMT